MTGNFDWNDNYQSSRVEWNGIERSQLLRKICSYYLLRFLHFGRNDEELRSKWHDKNTPSFWDTLHTFPSKNLECCRLFVECRCKITSERHQYLFFKTKHKALRLSERFYLLFPRRIWSVADSSSNAPVGTPQRDTNALLGWRCLVESNVRDSSGWRCIKLHKNTPSFWGTLHTFPSKNLECCRLFVECRCEIFSEWH